MIKKFALLLLGITFIGIVSCSPKQSEIVLAEYGEYEIQMKEFEKAYLKNAGSPEKAKEDSIESYKNFLDLYVNFKMKLRDAYVRDLHNDSRIIKELDQYNKTIGASYLLEKELVSKSMLDLYDKRAYELRVSHLLIRSDTISDEQAKAKAMAILEKINKGASFEDEVQLHTDDQFSKNKGGDIYYFTAGMIMPEFEDIAFDTEVGKVNPNPLKTKYGYHLIKVTDKIKRTPKVKASHILIGKERKEGLDSNQTILQLAEEVLDRAKKGEDFGQLAATYSDDPGSKAKNGDLGYFSRRQMVQPFDEAVFNLEVGEISDIVETQFGYHIIKLTAKEEYPAFDVEKKNLRELFEKTRRNSEYNKLIEQYSTEMDISSNDDLLTEITSSIDSEMYDESYWDSPLHNKYGSSVLFSINNQEFTVDSVISYAMKPGTNIGNIVTENNIQKALKDYRNNKIIETRASKLIEEDEKFADLMKEYKNGVIIFRLQEDEVWNKMKMDSTAIHNLFLETSDSYMWPNRVRYSEIFVKDEKLAKKCFELLNNGAEFDTLVERYNQNSKIPLNNANTLIESSTDKLSSMAFSLKSVGDFSEPIKFREGWSIVKLEEKLPSRMKTFEECRAEVTSAYQDLESKQLDNSYVSKLKQRYEPNIYYEGLKYAYDN